MSKMCTGLPVADSGAQHLTLRACDAGVSLPVVDEEDMESLAADSLYSSANCAQLLLQSTIVDKVTRPASR